MNFFVRYRFFNFGDELWSCVLLYYV